MKSNDDSQKTENVENKNIIAYVFGIFMIAVYCGMGYLMLFSTLFANQFPLIVRIVVGILLFIYGLFRAYRVVKQKSDE